MDTARQLILGAIVAIFSGVTVGMLVTSGYAQRPAGPIQGPAQSGPASKVPRDVPADVRHKIPATMRDIEELWLEIQTIRQALTQQGNSVVSINTRLGQVESRLAQVESRIAQAEKKLATHETKISALCKHAEAKPALAMPGLVLDIC